MIKDAKLMANEMIDFIYQSPTAFHAIKMSENILKENDFKELDMREVWGLQENGKYFVKWNDSMIVAFRVNNFKMTNQGFRIIASHSDSPGFKIKPNPVICSEGNYIKLNTEVYGGPILNTWLDRPLSFAGRVHLKSENVFNPTMKLININKPILIIPNLAIHMNRDINSGIELNKQTDTLPIFALEDEKVSHDYFLNILSKQLNVDKDEILDYELYLYEFEKGSIVGLNEEFISSSRLDNLSMLYTSLKALIDSKGNKGVDVMVCFDNEEVGSSTKQGAGSRLVCDILEKIAIGLGKTRSEFLANLYNSFMVSADLAHAIHPSKPQKTDPTNQPKLNKGLAIKLSAMQSYTSDSFSTSIFKEICQKDNIPYQIFVNRSDERGGSTIGPISSANLPIPSVDLGCPILAMHSIRELGGIYDNYHMYKSFVNYYNL